MKKLLSIFLFIIFSVALQADQAAWVTKREASKASKFVTVGEDVYFFCEPCGDEKPVKQKVKSKIVKSVGVKRLFELQINGKGADLAYVYVNRDSKYKNLAILIGIPVTGVSETLNFQSENNDSDYLKAALEESYSYSILSSYDLLNLLILSYNEKNDESYKRVSDNQINILTNVIEKIEQDGEKLLTDNKENINSIIALMDDLLAAFTNYSDYIEFKSDNMMEKVKYYLKSFEDQMNQLNNDISKGISINELKAENGVAIHLVSGEAYSGQAYLDFNDGTLRMVGTYKSGYKSGEWVYYVQDAKDKYYNLTFDEGYIISTKYNDGDRHWQGTPVVHEPDSEMPDGYYFVQEQETYNYNISPTIYLELVNNNPHGELTRWFPEGQMFSDGSFVNGNRQGAFRWWYKSGALKETSFWDNGKQIGKTTQYWENGNNYAVANYDKGVLSGKLIWWYENGQKKEEVYFTQGKRDTDSEKCWDKNGIKKKCESK